MKSSESQQKLSIVLRDALPHEMPEIVECAVSAFTKFNVFGPPWYDDAFLLPSTLKAMPIGYSRVAVEVSSGKIIGHAQWSCTSMNLEGSPVPVVILAPLSVHASWQNKGIGGLLMHDGISYMQQEGMRMLLVLGHESYYPRFGLLTHCHGRNGLTIPAPKGTTDVPEDWKLRPLADGDDRALMELWIKLCGKADGALYPGPGLLPWASCTRNIVSCVLEHKGKIMGHVRFDLRPECNTSNGVLRFLAASPDAARILAERMIGWSKWKGEALNIPLPSDQEQVLALFEGWSAAPVPLQERWSAGMAMDLAPDIKKPDISAHLASIKEGKKAPLFIEWPPLFDF